MARIEINFSIYIWTNLKTSGSRFQLWLGFLQTLHGIRLTARECKLSIKHYSPKTRGKSPSCIAMHELDWKPFKGMPVRDCSSDGLLKLFIPDGNSCTVL